MNKPPIKPTREWPESGFKVEAPSDSGSSDPRRPSRAQAWLRILLWLLPSGFALGSAWLLGWLDFWGGFRPHLVLSHPLAVWRIANALFVLGIACLCAKLSTSEKPRGSFGSYVVWFCISQLGLIPLIAALVIFGCCMANPV